MASSRKGYASGSPWRFSGRALYQMHLVKADIARRYVPSKLKLIEAFGYTLGGFFLAHYDESPVGAFDELVVIAGIVWNPPTSCAWAARVLVNNMEACSHGIQEVGLPSRLATFSQTTGNLARKNGGPVQKGTKSLHPVSKNVWNKHFPDEEHLEDSRCEHGMNIVRDQCNPWCHFSLPHSLLTETTNKGPPLSFSLPSFSGQTEQKPSLLKYSCNLNCRVSISKPASVSLPPQSKSELPDTGILQILSSKPVFTISFQDMSMSVQAPTLLDPKADPGSGIQASCS